MLGFVAMMLLTLEPCIAMSQQPAEPPARTARQAYLFEVPLPLQDDVDLTLRSQLEKRLAELPPGGERPIFVLEFAAPEGQSAEGSQFERAMSLARFLASERMSRVRTIAYLPRSVVGHAVLPVLACEEIAVAEDAELGAAGQGEQFVDGVMRDTYARVAELRRTVPAAVALGMLDRDLEVMRVETLDGGVNYVTGEELAELQAQGTVSKVETIVGRGDLANFTGRQLRLQYGFASQLANSREALARELGVPASALLESSPVQEGWTVVRVDLTGRVNSEQITRIIRLLEDRLRRGTGILVVLRLDSPGGSPADSLRLAHYLAGLDRTEARTCAWVVGHARSDAALIALACDDLAMSEGARLGGPGERFLRAEELVDLRAPVQQVAKAQQREWSLLMAMIDRDLPVYRYQRQGTGEQRLMSAEEAAEQPEPDRWNRGAQIATRDGLTTAEAVQLELVDYQADDLQQLLRQYEVREGAETLEAGWLISRIEELASKSWFSRTLLFVAFFALITEVSSPGLGVAGFLSAICFLLFFWAQFLNGTADWLEVVLFVGGIACMMLEIFLLPGFGVFGIGGALMVIASIVLASQTFVLPQNSYQMEQLPGSLFTVVAALFGAVAALFVVSRYAHRAPLLKNLALTPPSADDPEVERRATIADYRHLLHKPGRALTRLAPAGKARFGDEVVDVTTEGDFIAPDTPIYVVEVRGHHVVVRAVDGSV